MFIPDTAISNETEDELNRKDFARKLGETIRDWESGDSIVIGLFGPWGSGKTSILNLAISHIDETTQEWEKNRQPIIIPFNPWIFSEQDVLLQAFLQQVFSAVNDRLPLGKKDFQKQINALARTLGAFEKIPFAGPFLSLTGKTIDIINPQETLQSLRNKIDENFRSLDCRVIIVIDDIDRLTETEIRQLFQIIKVNADFPNTLYLLAFARDIIENALNTEQGVTGREYLEKIVQVGFDVPRAEPSSIEEILLRELIKILDSAKIDEKLWDQVRWGNIYYGGIRPLFDSIRDVKRFVNGLAFNLKMIAEEINPIDFIGLEALRIFIPEIYSAIANDKLLFTQATSLFGGNRRDQDELRSRFDYIFSQAAEAEDVGKHICFQLFPNVARIYEPMFSGDYRQTDWRRARRICSSDVFDFYFVLGTPEGEISRAELELIAQTANRPDELIQTFRRLLSEERSARLLDLLPDIRDDLDPEQALGLCEALLVLGDEMPNEHRGFLRLETDFHLALELYRTLHKVDQDQRCQWFEDQIRSKQTIYMPVYVVWHDTPQEDKTSDHQLFDPECFQRLKEACVEELVSRAQQRTLQNAKHLSLLMFRWRDWADDVQPINEFVEYLLSTQSTSLDLLVGFLSQAERASIGDHVSSTEWYINLENLGAFVDLLRLKEITDPISEDEAMDISEHHHRALSVFRKAMTEKGTEGGGTEVSEA